MLIIWWCPCTEKSLGLLENGVCWEGLGAGGEGDNRGWDGWMASPTRWTWVWVNSGSLWYTGRSGMLRFTGSQRVGHDWATKLNWTELQPVSYYNSYMCVCMWGMGGGSCVSITLCFSYLVFFFLILDILDNTVATLDSCWPTSPIFPSVICQIFGQWLGQLFYWSLFFYLMWSIWCQYSEDASSGLLGIIFWWEKVISTFSYCVFPRSYWQSYSAISLH